jgi:hypothetical protein
LDEVGRESHGGRLVGYDILTGVEFRCARALLLVAEVGSELKNGGYGRIEKSALAIFFFFLQQLGVEMAQELCCSSCAQVKISRSRIWGNRIETSWRNIVEARQGRQKQRHIDTTLLLMCWIFEQ